MLHFRIRDGVEQYGSPPCIVISTDDFNDSEARSIIAVPTKSADGFDREKSKVVPSTWVRIIMKGEARYALVEQVRYIDRSRCKGKVGELIEYDLKQVEDKLEQLFSQRRSISLRSAR